MSHTTGVYFVAVPWDQQTFSRVIGRGGANIKKFRAEWRRQHGEGCFIQLHTSPVDSEGEPLHITLPEGAVAGKSIRCPAPTHWPCGRGGTGLVAIKSPPSAVPLRLPSSLPADGKLKVAYIKLSTKKSLAKELLNKVWKVANDKPFHCRISVLDHLNTSIDEFERREVGAEFVGPRGKHIKKLCEGFDGSRVFLHRDGVLEVRGGNQQLVDKLLEKLTTIFNSRETPLTTTDDSDGVFDMLEEDFPTIQTDVDGDVTSVWVARAKCAADGPTAAQRLEDSLVRGKSFAEKPTSSPKKEDDVFVALADGEQWVDN